MNIPVLVVDDEYKSFRPRLDSIGNESGFAYTYIGAFSVEEILQKVSNIRDCGVLLLDICGPDGADSGIKVFKELGELEEWRLLQNRVQIVFFSADPTAKKEYEVARNRRSDVDGYVAKESVIRGAQEGLSVLRKAYQRALRYKGFGIFHDQEWVHKIREEHGLLSSPNTSSMKSVWEKVLMAGMCHEPVLIQGETGTGKELVAKAIYEVTRKAALGEATKSVENRRKILGQKKWIAYNIGSAPTEGNIQYTELFGAYPESASSISKYRKGIFEQATVYDEQGREPSGGTVFLDEIGDAAPIIQVSLLRVLQEKEVLPLGAFDGNDGKQKKVEFRLIAASHVDLPARVRDKDSGFRADLYYRLNTISIQLPPLRERKDDIPILVYHFLEELNRDYGREVSISDGNADKLFDRLKRYDWPGNVRQLQSAIRGSYVTTFGNELALSEDVEQMLDGGVPAPPLATQEILKSLDNSPRSLPHLAKEYGEPAAVEVARMWVERAHRHPNDEEANKYFVSSRGTVRKWMTDHGIYSPKGKNSKANRSDDSTET